MAEPAKGSQTAGGHMQHKGIPLTPESKMASSETQLKFLCEKARNMKNKQQEKLL